MRRSFGTFGGDRRGNFAVYGALLVIPLITGVGLAIDYANVSRAAASLQSTLDAAALTVAREGAKITDSEARKIIDDMVAANYAGSVTSLSLVRTGFSTKVAAVIQPDLAFGGIIGKQNWEIARESTATYADTIYQISFALDQTGSMEGAKLAAMKDAVNALVDAMGAQVKNPAKLKFSVVPYAAFVNVGPQYAPQFDAKGKVVKGSGADWLDVDGKVKTAQLELPANLSRFEVYHALGVQWPGCVETRDPAKGTDYDVTDAEGTSKDRESLFVPTFAIDEPDDMSGGWPLYPNNYINSTADPFDQSPSGLNAKLAKYGLTKIGGVIQKDPALTVAMDTSPSNFYSNESDPKGPQFDCEVEPILPLTSSAATVKGKVNAIKANGSTNITEGVMWGWRTLSDHAPFTEGASGTRTGLRKVLILLTDGTNSYGNLNNELKSGYTSTGYLADERLDGTTIGSSVGQTTAAMNAKTLAACTNAKADGIEIFTIRLEEPNVATGTLLQECASGPDHYFDSPTRDQLQPIFEQIHDKLKTVRLAS